MKIPLAYVKLRDTMDSTEPLNTTALSTERGWKLVLDTATGFIAGALTRGDGEHRVVRRVMFHAAAAAHWVPESWTWWDLDDMFGPATAMRGADPLSFLATQPQPQPQPKGGQRGRKASRARSDRPNAVQPEPAPGAEPDRDG